MRENELNEGKKRELSGRGMSEEGEVKENEENKGGKLIKCVD